MSEFKAGVVITVAAGRRENVELALDYLTRQELPPERVVLVLDGPDVEQVNWPDQAPFLIGALRLARKHEPGREQPRNAGVRVFDRSYTHVWFLDSDILTSPECLKRYAEASQRDRGAVLVGPYEWLPGEAREPVWDLYSDYRWEMFRERSRGDYGEYKVHVADLGVALGNFGGNLVWPIEEFKRIGGFHPQLHHGRCEDGELGLRAAAHRIPMILVPEARGWHLWHHVDIQAAVQRNTRDVPLLNSWHPWVEQQGIVMTEQDGVRFDFVCECGEQVNTLEMWNHLATHEKGSGASLILPEGM